MIRSKMVQRAVVERLETSGTDDGGQPITTWAELATIPCYLWSTAEVEAVTVERSTVVEALRMVVPFDADVHEDDRIVEVTDRKGTIYHPGPLNVRAVQRRLTHQELVLQAVA